MQVYLWVCQHNGGLSRCVVGLQIAQAWWGPRDCLLVQHRMWEAGQRDKQQRSVALARVPFLLHIGPGAPSRSIQTLSNSKPDVELHSFLS